VFPKPAVFRDADRRRMTRGALNGVHRRGSDGNSYSKYPLPYFSAGGTLGSTRRMCQPSESRW
jgi:hypothetical protein